MPIRVICPSCGRVGRGPDQAIGRTVRCPACSHSHRLTAGMVMPGEDEPLAGPPRTKPRPVAADTYDVDPNAVAPPRRPTRPAPVRPQTEAHEERPGGLTLPVPVLVGGVIGVALVSILGAWAFLGSSHDRAPAEPEVVASSPAPNPTEVPTIGAPIQEARSAAKPTSPSAAATRAPAETPAVVSAFDALQAPDDNAPEPAGESGVAAQARAPASVVAKSDSGVGKTLSTAEIVEESEPSVALIKGKSSSGTGFLVGPGLVATNAHVIDDEFISDLEVRFVSADDGHNSPLKAELLYEDPTRDLAFLAVKTDLKPLRVAKTYAFRKGEDITVIGNPGMGDGQVLENAISRGVMSTKIQIENRNFYQLGIAINPGNSGGPVFDSSGRVIGVATLKSMKQEATGFSIPIEDLQVALSKMSSESTADSDQYRSRHRLRCAVKGLGGGGALMCWLIDLRRADSMGNSPAIKELLGKLEPVAAELDKDTVPSLIVQTSRIKNDPLVAPSVKNKVSDLADNLSKIRGGYTNRKGVDDNQLRPWKQAHRRLLTELSASLKLEVPDGLLTAFNDHLPSQPTVITSGSQSLGQFSSRLRQRSMTVGPGTIIHPPGLRDPRRRSGLR